MSFYTGNARLIFSQHLGDDWRALADLLEILDHTRRRFTPGDEAQAIWGWLADHHQLPRLPGLLREIDRGEHVRYAYCHR